MIGNEEVSPNSTYSVSANLNRNGAPSSRWNYTFSSHSLHPLGTRERLLCFLPLLVRLTLIDHDADSADYFHSFLAFHIRFNCPKVILMISFSYSLFFTFHLFYNFNFEAVISIFFFYYSYRFLR